MGKKEFEFLFMLCLNNVRKSPAKLRSVTEGQVRHFLVNLSDLIPFVLSSSLHILAQLFWTLTASESAGGWVTTHRRHLQKLHHERSTLVDRKRTGHLALLGSWPWPLASLPGGFGMLSKWAGHPKSSPPCTLLPCSGPVWRSHVSLLNHFSV